MYVYTCARSTECQNKRVTGEDTNAGMEIACCIKRYIHGLVYILTIGAEELEVSDNGETAGDSDIYERPGNKYIRTMLPHNHFSFTIELQAESTEEEDD